MRSIFFIALLSVIFATLPAHGRLDETEDQCVTRYGPILKRVISDAEAGKSLAHLVFMKNGYILCAIMLDGKVGFLQITKASQTDLSDNEIDALLTDNSANQKWAKQGIISEKNAWFRDDGAQAQYDPSDHSLCLISKAYIDACNAAKKTDEDNKLKGF